MQGANDTGWQQAQQQSSHTERGDEITETQPLRLTMGDREEGDQATQRPSQRKTTGVPPQFPRLLHNMLCNADAADYSSIVSWQPHGKSFLIHDREKFVQQVMPRFFKMSKFSSFQRQLNLYGFLRLERKGPDHKSYYHERFLRDEPQLVESIGRIQSKGGSSFANWTPKPEPDFTGQKIPLPTASALTTAPTLGAAATTAVLAASAANPETFMSALPLQAMNPATFPSASYAYGAQKPPPPTAQQQQLQQQHQEDAQTHQRQQGNSPEEPRARKLSASIPGSSSDSTGGDTTQHKDLSSMVMFLEDVDFGEDSSCDADPKDQPD